MLNNDVLRSLRYTLNYSDSTVLEMLHHVDPELDLATLRSYLASEEEDSFAVMSDELLVGFLDNLIIALRGPSPNPAPATELPLSNNTILKKLRVAFALHEADLMDILESVDFPVSKPELSALFRKAGHHNYRECGDQLLRYFLKGLTFQLRLDAD